MNNHQPLVSIIILNYNAGELLLDCVESIFNSAYKNIQVIVVDNASNDESHKKCTEKFKEIILIENKENLGYCEGNNVGIRKADGKFIVILNPDTIVDPMWLLELLESYKKNGDGLYQPKFLATTDHSILLSTGQMINPFGFGFSRSKGDIDELQFEQFETINYASGTCLFTSTKIIKDLGMFDPFLFAYHDDLDLGWRALECGIKSYYVPTSIVYHPIEGYSFKWSKLKFYLLERNRHYCLLTHYARKTFWKMLPTLVLVDIIIFCFYLFKGMGYSIIKAHLDIIKNRQKINQRYKEIQNKRTVDDKTIIENFSDELIVPKWVVNDLSSKIFNNFIKGLSKIIKNIV